MISYDQAMAIIAKQSSPFATETVTLLEACGRILAEKIYAPIDSPLFDNSAMDGFALKFSDFTAYPTFKVLNTLHAGPNAPEPFYEEGGCVRIMTGAPTPSWCDTVIAVEQSKIDPSGRVAFYGTPTLGHHIRRQGDDIKAGAVLAESPLYLTPEIILGLAQFGIAAVTVRKRPRVVVLSTGDELVELGQSTRRGQIYNSSKYFLLAALAKDYDLVPDHCGIMNDDPTSALQTIEALISGDSPELLITTGAVSAGDKDFVPGVAKRLGFETLFHKVAIRPGKPVFFGRKGNCLWVGLPGNPVSSAVGWHFFVRPLLHHWANYPFPKQQKASIIDDIAKPEGLVCFFRGSLTHDQVSVHQKQGSAQLLASLSSNAYIILSNSNSQIKAGTIVNVQTV